MKIVACTTHIGTSVAAKRRRIPGVGEEGMLPHSDESTTTKTVSFRRNPPGRWGLRAISLLRAVVDDRTSTWVSRRDLTRKTHRRWPQYGWYRPLERVLLSIVSTAAGLVGLGCTGLVDTRVEFETFQQSQALDGFTELDVDLDYSVGRLEIIQGSENDLYSIGLDFDRLHFDPVLEFDDSGTRASLRFEMESIGRGISGNQFDNELVLRLNRTVLLNMRISTGVAESHLDLTDLKVRNLRLSGGVGRTAVLFDRPSDVEMGELDLDSGVGDVTVQGIGNARIGDLRVAGGVGRTELDFTGDWDDTPTRAEISVGIGTVKLLIPRELSVEIRSDDSFLSNFSAPSFERDGNRYTRNLSATEDVQVIIRIESGVGGVTVDLT